MAALRAPPGANRIAHRSCTLADLERFSVSPIAEPLQAFVLSRLLTANRFPLRLETL